MELGPNVTILEQADRTIYLVGTAHISEKSVEEVRYTIETVRPDTVCVELCKTRHDAMSDPDRWSKLDIFQIIKQKKVLFLTANLALSSYQKKLGDKLGVQPGAELREAVEVAKEIGAELVLVDRDIQATLKRTWANVGFFKKFAVIGSLFEGFFSKGEEITAEKLEALKDRDTISEMMAQFAKELPEVQVPLIDERDKYLMSATEAAPGKRIVCVVGAGHVEGMIGYQGLEVDREALSQIPVTKSWVKALKWIIPGLMFAAFYFGYRQNASKGLAVLIYAWALPNMVVAGLFTAIAGGKPLSVVCATLASPITSLNPTIGAGMVVGLVEAWLRKPTVQDCEAIPEDSKSLKGFYRNPFLRVMMVVVMATLGSAVGAWIGGVWVVGLVRTW